MASTPVPTVAHPNASTSDAQLNRIRIVLRMPNTKASEPYTKQPEAAATRPTTTTSDAQPKRIRIKLNLTPRNSSRSSTTQPETAATSPNATDSAIIMTSAQLRAEAKKTREARIAARRQRVLESRAEAAPSSSPTFADIQRVSGLPIRRQDIVDAWGNKGRTFTECIAAIEAKRQERVKQAFAKRSARKLEVRADLIRLLMSVESKL